MRGLRALHGAGRELGHSGGAEHSKWGEIVGTFGVVAAFAVRKHGRVSYMPSNGLIKAERNVMVDNLMQSRLLGQLETGKYTEFITHKIKIPRGECYYKYVLSRVENDIRE